MNLAHTLYAAGATKWRLDFSGWDSLSRERQVRLLIAIGDCDGEWWGNGRAEFSTMEDAVRVTGWAARLCVEPPPRLICAA